MERLVGMLAGRPAENARARELRSWTDMPFQVKLPDTPLILAGAFGGPLVPQTTSMHAKLPKLLACLRFGIFLLTPLRNALTLASQNPDSSAEEFGLVQRSMSACIKLGGQGMH